LFICGRSRKTELGRELDGLARSRSHLEGIVLSDKSDLLSHFEVGWVDLVVIETNVSTDGDFSIRPGTSSKNIKKRGLREVEGKKKSSAKETGVIIAVDRALSPSRLHWDP
jgi:hypothetical protein